MSTIKTTIIHHSADYDGQFCGQIAKKFLPGAELIGWDFGDAPVPLAGLADRIYVLDLPLDKVFVLPDAKFAARNKGFVWIDHHKSAIVSHSADIPGYRIDGVAACRLCWQWFSRQSNQELIAPPDGRFVSALPMKFEFKDRTVAEPLAVRLAGEYDVWDQSHGADEWRDCLAFQFGLDAQKTIDWAALLTADIFTKPILQDGHVAMRCLVKRDADAVRKSGFLVEFSGLKFLALNTAGRFNSGTFAERDVPATGHDALMAFGFDGKAWKVSLRQAAHRKDVDLSAVAVAHGGGGHAGAAGFACGALPFKLRGP